MTNPQALRAAFWYPSRVIGGAESLLIRLITQLSTRGVECHMWDYSDGHISRTLLDRGVCFKAVVCDSLGFPPQDALEGFDSDDLVTVFHTHLFKLPRLPRSACRILLWEVHNAFWLDSASKATDRLKWERCATLLSHGALATIEPGSVELMRIKGLSANRTPRIPISVDDAKFLRTGWTRKPTCFVGMGRASLDKVIGPAWAFDQIARRNAAARFAYLTDDPARARALFRRVTPELAARIELPTKCTGLVAQQWLVENADVFFGMGTSALDAAKNGVPTIIVDNCESSKYPQDARVRLLWENEGHNTVSASPSESVGRTLTEALDIIAANPENAADKSVSYVTAHHAGDSTHANFIAAWKDDSMRLDAFIADPAFANFARKEYARLRIQEFRRALKNRLRALFLRKPRP